MFTNAKNRILGSIFGDLAKKSKKAYRFLIASAVIAILALVLGLWLWYSNRDVPEESDKRELVFVAGQLYFIDQG